MHLHRKRLIFYVEYMLSTNGKVNCLFHTWNPKRLCPRVAEARMLLNWVHELSTTRPRVVELAKDLYRILGLQDHITEDPSADRHCLFTKIIYLLGEWPNDDRAKNNNLALWTLTGSSP